METTSSHPDGAGVALGLAHLVVGAATVVLGGVAVYTSQAPGAELEGALIGPGVLLTLAGLAFCYAAVQTVRRARHGHVGRLSPALSGIELVAGIALLGGVVAAVQAYGVFEPWRSPLLLPSVALTALGLLGALHTLGARGR
jgi:hypothetical protein